MKLLPIFTITMLLAFSLQAQDIPNPFGQREYKNHRNQSPYQSFIQKHPNQHTKGGEIRVPGKGFFYDPELDKPVREITFHYDKDGLLLYTKDYSLPGGSYFNGNIMKYNETFRKPGENILDTAVIYYDPDFKIPSQRRYYNYHYYDVSPTDSFYMEYIIQNWDQTNKKWVNYYKDYEGYIDTVLFEINRIESFSGNGDGWQIMDGMRDSLVYDERGYATGLYRKVYSSKIGRYEWWYKREHLLNEDGSIYEFYAYYYENNDWKLYWKTADITWLEWHGYGGYSPIVYIGYEPPLIGYKQNKKKSCARYNFVDGGWEFYRHYKYDWDFDGYGSHTDSTFYLYDNGIPSFPSSIVGNFYNQYGDYIEYRGANWDPPDENGIQIRAETCNFVFKFHYNEYGYDLKEGWYFCWNNEIQEYDSTIHYKLVITEYIDPTIDNIVEQTVIQPLSIAPNPVSGVATIAAATEIKQLQIFDITGKLMKEQVVSADKTVFDTGNLPKGIYIVQALLKNGERQMGKLVVP